WFYGTVRLPAQPEAELLSRPPREALVEMEIKRIMQAETRYGKSTGVARVIRANETSRLEKNSLIYLRLSPHDTAEFEIMRGLAIQLTAVVRPIPEHVPPDSFDAYLQEIGIHYRLEQTSGARILRQPTPFQRLCHQANRKFENFLKLGEPEDSQLSQIYVAMLLGEKAQLSDEQSDRFRMTGTMHLFAISGLHIGVIATVIWQVLLLCRLPSKLRPFLGLPLLYFYVEITGAAPSAVRAFLMVAFFWVSMGLQRQRSPLSALAASAVLVLLVQPLQLWQMGFQLSYLVVISILMFGLPLREQLWPLLRPNKFLPEADWSRFQIVKHWLADKLLLLFAISFSAWLASAPLSAGFFGFIAPYAILVNMFLVNLAALVISGGVIALSFACIGLEGLTSFLNHSAWMGISLMDALVRFNLALPWAIVECPEFPAALSYSGILAYLAAIFILGRKYKASIRFTLPVAVVLACLALGLAAGP
ncbi:MAG TPA: ComEC/Rec2 family competence protein, partial [Opitutales bacterium]|nr:ComEC/Rec2 family competence protein [Opitutales bacterium]